MRGLSRVTALVVVRPTSRASPCEAARARRSLVEMRFGLALAAMGRRAVAAFEEAERLAGLVGKVRLASMCSVTSAEAAAVEDTGELVQRLERGLDVLRGQFGRKAPAELTAPEASAPETVDHLRRHLRAHLELLSQQRGLLGNPMQTIRRIDETAAQTLRVGRVSVWRLVSDPTRILCLDLYERDEQRHSDGIELFERDFPAYFKALATERTIAAHQAVTDPRTSCFADSYLTPLGIAAMLDVPIWVGGRMWGVVCHEHVGSPRVWNADEETFAYLMSAYVSLSLEATPLDP